MFPIMFSLIGRLIVSVQGHLSALMDASRDSKMNILTYLVTAETFTFILDLPLLPTIGGNYISLVYSSSSSYRLFTSSEVSLFGIYDPNGIPIDDLPGAVSSLFSRLPLEYYNVQHLRCEDVVEYVVTAFSSHGIAVEGLGLDFVCSVDMMAWLTALWEWAAAQTTNIRDPLRALLGGLNVLPTAAGRLCRAGDGVLLTSDPFSDVASQSILEKLGFHFLPPTISPIVLEYLRQANYVHTISAPSVLGKYESHMIQRLDDQDIDRLQTLLSNILPHSPPLTYDCRSRLCALPIFPLLQRDQAVIFPTKGSISPGAIVKLVASNSRHPLPVVTDIIFIVDSAVGRSLARAVDPDVIVLSDLDILRMALDHFLAQPEYLKVLFVERMAANPRSIPTQLIHLLGQQPFVRTEDGTLLKPVEVVDPLSETARELMVEADPHLPRQVTDVERRTVSSLKTLNLLITALTPAIATDLIERIAHPSSRLSSPYKQAAKLLKFMNASSFDPSGIVLRDDLTWIPVEGGELCKPTQCRDSTASSESSRSRMLFDKVLSVSTVRVTSEALRELIGWEPNVSLPVVKAQFRACAASCGLSTDPSLPRYMSCLIKEFGRRFAELTANDFDELRGAVAHRQWIPVQDTVRSVMCETQHTVFSLDATLPPFCVYHSSSPGELQFLRAMGCTDRYLLCLWLPKYSANALS